MQKWKYNECMCEWKELDDSSSFKNNYMQNPSTCDFEYGNTY